MLAAVARRHRAHRAAAAGAPRPARAGAGERRRRHRRARRRAPRAAHAGDPHARQRCSRAAALAVGLAALVKPAFAFAPPERNAPPPPQPPGVLGARRPRRGVRRGRRARRPRPLGRRRARRRRPADVSPAERRALDPAALDVADRPVRAAARARQLPQQRRRRAAQHRAAVAQRLPRPPADHVLPRHDGDRGVRRRPRAARAARRLPCSPPRWSSPCPSSASRRSRARCPTRSCGRRSPAACCSSCATRAASRRSDLVLAGVALGIAAGTKWYGVSSVAVVVVIWARRAPRPRARRPAAAPSLRDSRARRRPLACSACCPGWRATSRSPTTPSSR